MEGDVDNNSKRIIAVPRRKMMSMPNVKQKLTVEEFHQAGRNGVFLPGCTRGTHRGRAHPYDTNRRQTCQHGKIFGSLKNLWVKKEKKRVKNKA
jgi:hypothetical protein